MRTPPGMTCSFLMQLVFCKKKYVVLSGHQSVMPFLSGAPGPKKIPGSAPGLFYNSYYFSVFSSVLVSTEKTLVKDQLRRNTQDSA